MDFALVLPYWRFLARALAMTLLITATSITLGAAIGILVAVGRTYGGRLLNTILGFYVDTMRAIPLLVILIWTYFVFPLALGWDLSPVVAASLGLSAHLGAYAAETIRAGLTSVRPGQMRAALALGMSRASAIRTIILPQALIRMLPPIGSLLVFAVKDSGIASVIAVPELIRQSQVLSSITYHPFEVYTLAMGIYFLLCYPLARGVDALYRRVAYLGAS
jgi:His/Glu/Gln/Arg/opine family amino acid ABC transporter permease subunit